MVMFVMILIPGAENVMVIDVGRFHPRVTVSIMISPLEHGLMRMLTRLKNALMSLTVDTNTITESITRYLLRIGRATTVKLVATSQQLVRMSARKGFIINPTFYKEVEAVGDSLILNLGPLSAPL
jgi:hypothetical protein